MERQIDLPPDYWNALDRLAQTDAASVSALVQEAIRREMLRRGRSPKTDQPDEAALSPLRALLADDFAYAANWSDLAARLARKGYGLMESGPGLVLVALPRGERVCKASDLGYSHARLARKFATAFPHHAQGWRVVQRTG
jgi:hypothetical protein